MGRFSTGVENTYLRPPRSGVSPERIPITVQTR